MIFIRGPCGAAEDEWEVMLNWRGNGEREDGDGFFLSELRV